MVPGSTPMDWSSGRGSGPHKVQGVTLFHEVFLPFLFGSGTPPHWPPQNGYTKKDVRSFLSSWGIPHAVLHMLSVPTSRSRELHHLDSVPEGPAHIHAQAYLAWLTVNVAILHGATAPTDVPGSASADPASFPVS